MTKQDRDPVRGPGAIQLPVTRTTIRTSTAGRWRAAVLLLVHLLIAIHIAHWLSGADTLTPLEPSEAMQFTQSGIVNAGVIFFALTILSTAILGRWFCGWACHVVALQDATLWLLARLGIRPRPIRSRLLMLIPLLAFLYMFISPLLYGRGPGQTELEYELTTTDFWKTFPTWIPAALTFLTVGVLAVYLLGAKGFCTNGCPYAGAFVLADRLAPYRIRVTDACTRCGHCTAVCSSNVRVHSEVHDYGMVVDPGCMKCLDCVSVCPNDALYFGAAPQVAPRRKRRRPAVLTADRLLQFAFAIVALLAMIAAGQAYQATGIDLLVAAALAAVAVALTWAGSTGAESAGRPLTLTEEVVVGTAFLVGLIATRGLFGAVAFLFALGLGGLVAYAALLAFRLARSPAVGLHAWTLKRQGRLRPEGYLAVALLALGTGGLAVAAQVRWQEVKTLRAFVRATEFERSLAPLLTRFQQGPLAEDEAATLRIGLKELVRLRPDAADPVLNLGLLLARTGDVAAARNLLRDAVTRIPDDPRLWFNLALYEAECGDLDAGIDCLGTILAENPADTAARRMRANMRLGRQRWQAAADDLRILIEGGDRDPELRQMLAFCEARLEP